MGTINKILQENLELAAKSAIVLNESIDSVKLIFAKGADHQLTKSERESCEALTARYARLCDLLIQKIFRSVDEAELIFEGSLIDRLNRMEKREIISSTELWKNLRILRNDIAHEYLIDEAKNTLREAFNNSFILLDALDKLKNYCIDKKLV